MADCDRDFVINKLKNINDISSYDIYEFGIFTGGSFKHIYDNLCLINKIPNKIWGFDSFEGLPKEKENLPIYDGWEEGYFKIDDKNIIDTISNSINGSIKFELIKGYFENTLNDNFLKKNPKKAIYIDIDCDLYISTYVVLDFMFKNNLIANNCYISYDDWGGIEEYSGGESLAHKEIMEKYFVEYEEIFSKGDGKPHKHKVFLIKNFI